jgi:hypothetical protein
VPRGAARGLSRAGEEGSIGKIVEHLKALGPPACAPTVPVLFERAGALRRQDPARHSGR